MKLTKLEQFVADNPNMTFETMAAQLNRTPDAMERAYDRLERKRKAQAPAQTHAEKMESAPIKAALARELLSGWRRDILTLEAALNSPVLTRYQRARLKNATISLGLADADLSDYTQSLRADGAGYSIER